MTTQKIKLASSPFEGKYAAPRIKLTGGPAMWKIEEVRIVGPCRVQGQPEYKVWIRGEDAMWHRADYCEIDCKERIEAFVAFVEEEDDEA